VSLKRKNFYFGLFLLTPSILLMVFVTIYPIFYGFRFSFFQTHYLNTIKFIGLKNYVDILKDFHTIINIKNSLIFVFGNLIFSLPIGVGLAILLNKNIKFITFFRTVIIFPWVISQTVTALLWLWLVDINFGPFNYIIKQMGFAPIDFLSSGKGSMWLVIMANVWREFPFPLVLSLAALRTIPNELYEAIKVDGGTAFQSSIYVTIPWIATPLLSVIILLALENIKMVTLIYVMTGGGPLNATEVISVRAFKEAFWHWRMNYATALAMFILIINVIFGIAYTKIIKSQKI